jgi:hypothetical protein
VTVSDLLNIASSIGTGCFALSIAFAGLGTVLKFARWAFG